MPYERLSSQPENPFSPLIPSQTLIRIPHFTLESGVTLHNVPVAYKTWGRLAQQRDNCLVVCHALSGSSDVGDWWGPLLGGPGRLFDVSRFFVVCVNALGSPYGTASPVTARDGVGERGCYGPEFPLTTIRDDVRLTKLLLDDLGVKEIAAVVGGSMGGMLVLEFAYFGPEYVKTIVPIATSARHSAWCISWGEGQRQAIYSDFRYEDGYYSHDEPPATGLGAARMQALLTYRSRDSFESRFGRNTPDPRRQLNISGGERPQSASNNDHFAIHNEGHQRAGSPRTQPNGSAVPTTPTLPNSAEQQAPNGHTTVSVTDPQFHGATPLATDLTPREVSQQSKRPTTYFSANSYLRYQSQKFIKRFDANCYIAITRKLDTHDVSYHAPDPYAPTAVADALGTIKQPALVLGIESDGLFTFQEQEEVARGIGSNARLEKIESPEGHDAFLLQFKQVNEFVLGFLQQHLRHIYGRAPTDETAAKEEGMGSGDIGTLSKNSVFGEAEVDIQAW